MENLSYESLPRTSEMFEKMKRPRKRTPVDKIEIVLFYLAIALFAASFVVASLEAAGWFPSSYAHLALLAFFALILIFFLVWSVSQLIAAAVAIKGGFRRIAEEVDQEIEFEDKIVASLLRCDPKELRERATHLDLKVKRLTRRAGISTTLTAIGVVVLNIRDAGQESWGRLEDMALFVYSGSLGVLIGAAILIVLSGRLEKISGLFQLAADRLGSS